MRSGRRPVGGGHRKPARIERVIGVRPIDDVAERGNYSLSGNAAVAPTGVAAHDWLQIIYMVWQEMSAVGQLQSIYTYTQGTLNTAQSTANTLISGAITTMQAKTDDSTLLDFGQRLKDLGYSLVWFFPETVAPRANLAVVAVTDVIRMITSALGGTSSLITIGQYWDQVADSSKRAIRASVTSTPPSPATTGA